MRRVLPLLTALAFAGTAFAVESPAPTPTPAPKAEAPDAKAGRLKNTLRWKTASEVNNVGFDVYRSTAKDGRFERITPKPIPGAGTSDEPHEYAWADDTIEPGTAYWYFVESISLTGVREKFTPTFKAPVKHLAPTSSGPNKKTPAP
ncbi:MAG: hypothetical protein ACYDBY_01115 [Thermoanaerobaculia bacterium]